MGVLAWWPRSSPPRSWRRSVPEKMGPAKHCSRPGGRDRRHDRPDPFAAVRSPIPPTPRAARSGGAICGVAPVGGEGRGPRRGCGGGVAIATTWLSLFNVGTLSPRGFVRDSAAGRARPSDPWLQLHLLLEPPVHAADPVHVGDPRRAPFERAVQPVDCAARARRHGLRTLPRTGCCASSGSGPRSSRRRGVNLLYRYCIHADTIPKLGPVRDVFNTASHHGAHGGTAVPRPQPRQHPDRVGQAFGTFEPEGRRRVRATKNIHTFNLAKVAVHEHRTSARRRAVTNSTDRLNFVLRGRMGLRPHAAAGDLRPAGYD